MALTPIEGKPAMTVITPTAPTITPCPVDWCPKAGRHEWLPDHLGMDPDRIHKHVTLCTPNGHGRDIVVAAELFETEESSAPSVELYDADALHSREQMEQVIVAMREAADLAFGPVPRGAADDFDAAVKEIVERAANPTDVNRLVAAAIRFRNAYLAVDAELDAE